MIFCSHLVGSLIFVALTVMSLTEKASVENLMAGVVRSISENLIHSSVHFRLFTLLLVYRYIMFEFGV